jgi:hypothetical protein
MWTASCWTGLYWSIKSLLYAKKTEAHERSGFLVIGLIDRVNR